MRQRPEANTTDEGRGGYESSAANDPNADSHETAEKPPSHPCTSFLLSASAFSWGGWWERGAKEVDG